MGSEEPNDVPDLTVKVEMGENGCTDNGVTSNSIVEHTGQDQSLLEPMQVQEKLEEMNTCSSCCPSYCKLPSFLRKVLPPRGRFGAYATRCVACVVVWAALLSITGKNALPGGNIFSLFVLLVASTLGGWAVGWKTQYFSFPPLLGMLIVGFMLSNIDAINLHQHITPSWSSALRSTALCVILLRSGLGLDIAALRRLKWTVVRLAFVPCLSEAVTVAVVARLLLNMPWLFAFQLGFILGAVSPAVVVPSMLALQESNLGTNEGIPTLVMASSSCDDVLAISAFGIFLGISFSEGNIYFNIFRGPLEIVMGISAGLLTGMLLWYLPSRRSAGVSANRSILIIGFALMYLFGSGLLEFPGAGALSVLCMGATAGYGWGEAGKQPVEHVMGVLWTLFQPMLFGLIGAEVKISYLDRNLVASGVATLAVGLVVRCAVTYIVVLGNNLNLKEKLFCVISWLPKATVQAAIGSLCLDTARNWDTTNVKEKANALQYGRQILTIAVLVILITAPIGAIGISVAGPRWLKKADDVNDER